MPETKRDQKIIGARVLLGILVALSGGCSSRQETSVPASRCSHSALLADIAGANAIDCGRAVPNESFDAWQFMADRMRVDTCVSGAFAAGRPFYASYFHEFYEVGYAMTDGQMSTTLYDHDSFEGRAYGTVSKGACIHPILRDLQRRWEGEWDLFDCGIGSYDFQTVCSYLDPAPRIR